MDKTVLYCSFIKYLRIYIDEHLNWKKHIRTLSNKLKRANGALSKLRYYLPVHVLISVYYAIFNSHQMWGQKHNHITNRMFILQRSAIRIMHNAPKHTHTYPLYSSLKILKYLT